MPLSAFADADNSGGGARQGGAAELLAAGNVLAAQGDGRGDAGISGADLIKKLVEAAAVAAIDPEEAATMGAEWAAELFCEKVLGISAGDANDAVLLAAVLAPTRWSVAYCADLGTAGALIYDQNALWALRRVASVWGGEVTPVITVSGGRVATWAIRLDDERGSWNGLRFTYGKNMAGCTRTVLEQDVYTALYGYGAGLPYTDQDGNYVAGYRRKLTFGDSVVARVTIGTVQPVDYASVSSLAADVTGIDGNLTTAASVAVVENTVTTAIDDLDELAEVEF